MAYIVGVLAGVYEDKIVEGISKYRSHGSRQNLVQYGGYTLYMDCYNVTNDTIVSAVNNLGSLDVEPNAKRIAVIGGENRLGENRISATKELGRRVAEAAEGKIDEIICYGNSSDEEEKLNWYGDAPLLYKSIIDNGYEKVKLIRTFDDMADYLKKNINGSRNSSAIFTCIRNSPGRNMRPPARSAAFLRACRISGSFPSGHRQGPAWQRGSARQHARWNYSTSVRIHG